MLQKQTLVLLQKIADNTSSNDSLWVAAIAGGSAVLGAAISALIAYFAANRSTVVQLAAIKTNSKLEHKKLKASIVTTERLRWLQELRAKVAEFYSHIDMQVMHVARLVNPAATPISRDEMDSISKEAGLRANLVLLMLNPTNVEQQELYQSINSALMFVNKALMEAGASATAPDRAEITRIKKQSFDSMHKIGSVAWNKVQELN
ncbi:hypothetical protein ACM9XA_19025 [Xanthomonas sacchari]